MNADAPGRKLRSRGAGGRGGVGQHKERRDEACRGGAPPEALAQAGPAYARQGAPAPQNGASLHGVLSGGQALDGLARAPLGLQLGRARLQGPRKALQRAPWGKGRRARGAGGRGAGAVGGGRAGAGRGAGRGGAERARPW
jgi:hypothetical protein